MRGNFPELSEPQLGLGSGAGGRMGGPGSWVGMGWGGPHTHPPRGPRDLGFPRTGVGGGTQGAKRGEEGQGGKNTLLSHKLQRAQLGLLSLFLTPTPES